MEPRQARQGLRVRTEENLLSRADLLQRLSWPLDGYTTVTNRQPERYGALLAPVPKTNGAAWYVRHEGAMPPEVALYLLEELLIPLPLPVGIGWEKIGPGMRSPAGSEGITPEQRPGRGIDL